MRPTLDTPKPGGKSPVSAKRPACKPRAGVSSKAAKSSVDAIIQTPPDPTAAGRLAPGPLTEKLKAGLPIEELAHLGTYLDMSMEKLAPMLGISWDASTTACTHEAARVAPREAKTRCHGL